MLSNPPSQASQSDFLPPSTSCSLAPLIWCWQKEKKHNLHRSHTLPFLIRLGIKLLHKIFLVKESFFNFLSGGMLLFVWFRLPLFCFGLFLRQKGLSSIRLLIRSWWRQNLLRELTRGWQAVVATVPLVPLVPLVLVWGMIENKKGRKCFIATFS